VLTDTKKKRAISFLSSSPISSVLAHLFDPGAWKNTTRLSVVLLDSGLKSDRVGANDLADLLAVLEEQESGHGAHALLLGDLGDLVDVDLVEAGVGVVVGEPDVRSVC
jgi:hypothetical protein